GSITVVPGVTAAGDLMVMVVMVSGGTAPTTPTGWTQKVNITDSSSTARLLLYTRTATSNSESSVTISVASQALIGVIYTYGNAYIPNMLDGVTPATSFSTTGGGNNSSTTSPSITSVTAYDTLLTVTGDIASGGPATAWTSATLS